MFISGIASGLETEKLIESLLAIERRPMVHMQEQKNLLMQQRDAWRDVNTRLNHLRERMGALRSETLFHGRTAVSSAADIVSAAAKKEAAEGRYQINVTQLAEAHRVASFRFEDADAALGFEGSFTIKTGADSEGVAIDVGSGDSLKDVAAKINEAEGVGVAATVIDGRIVLRSLETGTANSIVFEGPEGLLGGVPQGGGQPTGLGFVQEGGQGLEIRETLSAARDAVFTVEGLTVERSSNVVDDVIDGVTFTLRDEGAAEITVKKDHDGVVGAVRALVEQYNSLQSFISTAQASNPEAGRKGLLAGDGLAMRIQSQLRTGIMGSVGASGGKYNNLMAVGVSVDRYGTMSLDESKLRAALDDDPDAVQRLFGAEKESDGFDGVAVRLESAFQGWLEANTGVLAERQKMFGDRMRSIDRSMERIEARLELRERTLMRQFTALEEVLAGFQTQAMWLDGQIQQLNAMAAANRR